MRPATRNRPPVIDPAEDQHFRCVQRADHASRDRLGGHPRFDLLPAAPSRPVGMHDVLDDDTFDAGLSMVAQPGSSPGEIGSHRHQRQPRRAGDTRAQRERGGSASACGHGVEAAKLTAVARYTVRSQGTGPGATPARVLSRVNDALLARRAGRFLTAAIAHLCPEGEGCATRSCALCARRADHSTLDTVSNGAARSLRPVPAIDCEGAGDSRPRQVPQGAHQGRDSGIRSGAAAEHAS